MQTRTIDTDVLVIGGGLAGCWAAIRARELTDRVTLIDKAMVARSGASTFTNSMLAPTPEGALEQWRTEIVEAGEYLNDQQWVDILLTEQPLRIRQMAGWGVPFERDTQGNFRTTPGRGHKNTRMIMCNGHRLMDVMKQQVLDRGVQLLPRIMMLDLLTSDGLHPTAGRIIGAAGLHGRDGDLVVCRAKAVVITSGVMDSKLRLLYINNLTGDGPAMAYRAGAELLGMEFCMVSKITRYEGKYYGGGSSLLQGFGARFINRLGEEFIGKYDPELKNRARVSYLCQAFAKEHYEGRGPVYLDMTSFSDEDAATVKKMLSSQFRPLAKAGIDPQKHPLVIDPVVSIGTPSGQGGIRVDTDCRSTIPGLLAGGAAARNMVHGTYTVGGINLAFCNVSGYRAGENAAKTARESALETPRADQLKALEQNFFAPLHRSGGVSTGEALDQFHKISIPAPVSLFKNEARLKKALLKLQALALDLNRLCARDIHDLVRAKEIENLVPLARLVFTAALARTESRDTHYREDYPFRDDVNWLKWIILQRAGDDDIRLRLEPVPLEQYPVQPAQRRRIPYPVQYTLGEKHNEY
ncbi:MAG: FAD-binding protein [Desulfobacterales bacterium]|nr:FAD-binding protein [Desulfobacterales bacterium]